MAHDRRESGRREFDEAKKPPFPRAFAKRMKGLEPSTFCMASRPDGHDA